jgi:hypothetical protein
MGRKPGRTPDKLKLARKAFQGLEAERERLAETGLGPGEAYRGLWNMLADYRTMMLGTRKALNGKSGKRVALIARHDWLMERVVDILRALLPYERRRLQAIQVAGDQNNSSRVKPDLTKLSLAELDQLEKIVLKVGGATATAIDTGANEPRRLAPGAAASVRRGRAAKNRTELR